MIFLHYEPKEAYNTEKTHLALVLHAPNIIKDIVITKMKRFFKKTSWPFICCARINSLPRNNFYGILSGKSDQHYDMLLLTHFVFEILFFPLKSMKVFPLRNLVRVQQNVKFVIKKFQNFLFLPSYEVRIRRGAKEYFL